LLESIVESNRFNNSFGTEIGIVSNPKAISLFYISKMRAEGDELELNRQEMSPAGIPTSITFIYHRATRQAADNNRTPKPIIEILTDNEFEKVEVES